MRQKIPTNSGYKLQKVYTEPYLFSNHKKTITLKLICEAIPISVSRDTENLFINQNVLEQEDIIINCY